MTRPGLAAARIVLVLLLLGALALAGSISFRRAFQVDEVEHVHATYNLLDGRMIYRDFWEGHNPLLYGLLAPFVDAEDPVGSFQRARIVPLAAFLGIVGVGVVVGRRMAGETGGWLAAALLLMQSTLVERGLEVRADGLLGLASLSAFALETSRLPQRRRSLLAALVLGLAFVATQKAAFVCLAFAGLWAIRALRERRPSLLLGPAAVGVAPFLAALAWIAWNGALADYWMVNVGDNLRRVGRTAPTGGEFSPAVFLVHEGRHNLAFWLLACAALGAGLVQGARLRWSGARLGLAALAWLLVATLWLNPFPFPYLQASVLPTLAVFTAVVVAESLGRSRTFASKGARLAAVLLIAVLCAATAAPRLASRGDRPMDRQMEVLAEIQRITSPNDPVFDLAGLYFRPDAYPVFTMTGVMLSRYRAGHFPRMVPTLEETAPAVLVLNYRTRALRGEERRFLTDHFVHHDGPIFVQGLGIEGLEPGDSRIFRALAAREFQWFGEPGLLVDGAPFSRGTLSAGEHHLSTERSLGRGRLALASARTLRPPRAPFVLFPTFD